MRVRKKFTWQSPAMAKNFEFTPGFNPITAAAIANK